MKFKKCGRWTWKDIYIFPIAWCLGLLVKRNYKLRIAGKLPDEWYWADIYLLNLGYVVMAESCDILG